MLYVLLLHSSGFFLAPIYFHDKDECYKTAQKVATSTQIKISQLCIPYKKDADGNYIKVGG